MSASDRRTSAIVIGRSLLGGALWPAVLALGILPGGAAHGQTTFVVNTAADLVNGTPDGVCDVGGGQCSLREAVMEANFLPGADRIVFDPSTNGMFFTLMRPCDPLGCYFDQGTDGDLDVWDDLTITGNGPSNTVIQGGTSVATAFDRVFEAFAALSISGVTIRHGNSGGEGGGIVTYDLLTATDSVITGNLASGFGQGGGIYSQGGLILARVSISDNEAALGGGVYWHTEQALLSITDSTFEGNRATLMGGGLVSSLFGPAPPIIVISNTTFSGNIAPESCAVLHANAPLRLHSVTVADNCTPGSGAAAVVVSYGDGNGNIGGEVLLKNSVLTSPAGTDNCRVVIGGGVPPGFASEGHNLSTDATCGLVQAGDVQGASPLLGPLANNGGPTRTHLPLPGSPAIDTGTPVDCLSVDQRGLGRPSDGGSGSAVCDKGSVEVAAAPPPPPPTTAAIQGIAWDDDNANLALDLGEGGLPGVQVCLFPTIPSTCTFTAADGTYQFAGLTPGSYHVYIRVPAGRIASTPRARLVAVAPGAATTGIDFGTFAPPPPPPPPPGLPGWDAPVITQAVKGFFFVVRVTPPCVANSVTVSAFYAGFTDTRPMLRVPGSTNQWEATFPTSAAGSVLPYRIEADCTPRAFSGFFVFVDPSGAILDGCTGQPLSGATVTLLKNEPYGSSTYVVPEPTEHIPSFNPEVTAADGLYGWDVVPGRWRVRASKPGYDTVTTDPFDVPPPKLNLDITLTPIAGCNVPPVAHDDAYAADQGTPLNVAAPGVLGNDTDANGNPLTASIVANATNGNVTLNSDGSFTYTPNTGFHGTDTFTYKASDGTQDSNLATATIAVGQVNQPPSAVNDAYSTRKNRTLIVGRPGVLANDSDPEGAALTAVLVRRPTRGILLLSPHGSFVYLPRPGFVGRDTFTYKASDGARSSGVTTVTIDVTRKRHRGHGDHDDDDDCDEDDARRLER